MAATLKVNPVPMKRQNTSILRDSSGRVATPVRTHKEFVMKYATRLFKYLKQLAIEKGYNEHVIEKFNSYESVIGLVCMKKDAWIQNQMQVLTETLTYYKFDTKNFTDKEIAKIRDYCNVIYQYTIEQIIPLMEDKDAVDKYIAAAAKSEADAEAMMEASPNVETTQAAPPTVKTREDEPKQKVTVINWCKECMGMMHNMPDGSIVCTRCIRKVHNSRRKTSDEPECKCDICTYSTNQKSVPEPKKK